MSDFGAMRQALSSGIIDGYISERPEALTAEAASSTYKMIALKKVTDSRSLTTTFRLPLVFVRTIQKHSLKLIRSLPLLVKMTELKLMNHIISIQPAENMMKQRRLASLAKWQLF